MKTTMKQLGRYVYCGALLWLTAVAALGAIRHVWQDSPNPTPPYADWATAAHTIQEAIDMALEGDTVLVTNGVFASGGRSVDGLMTNRVAVTKAVTLRSVNGPEVTIIRGAKAPGGGDGDGAIRCVYLTSGAILSGFTLTNGGTRGFDDSVTEGRRGGGVWCASSRAILTNCVLIGNSASWEGGGAYSGTLYNCTLTSNLASGPYGHGGGACVSTLYRCAILDCKSGRDGGGAYVCTLLNCTISGNVATFGGGAYISTAYNCILNGNSADMGGGAWQGTFYNCTLTGNSATTRGGGVIGSAVLNCIVYHNSAPDGPNHRDSTLCYSCTTPLPPGEGNMDAEPLLASATHLSVHSPCIGAGRSAYASGLDIDGEPWGVPPSMGCDEPRPGSLRGPLVVSIGASRTYARVGQPVQFTTLIEGRVAASQWEFGDGTIVSNRPYVSHAWASVGQYEVRLRAYNESYPAGIAATLTILVLQPVVYVFSASPNPTPPYADWATAAHSVQEAIDMALEGDTVLVTNGVYEPISVIKPITVLSVNGPAVTTIDGGGSSRCAWLGTNTLLSGFTLTNGRADYGGGVRCASASAVVTNCTLTGNSASLYGGGTWHGTLYKCTLTGNSADYGGGAYDGMLYNCTVTGNSASGIGGGVYKGTHYNGIVYYNTAPNGPNYAGDTAFRYTCTTPLPPGEGNMDTDPLLASATRLSVHSPCIGAGSSAYASGLDIDGEPWGVPPSMGCDEPHPDSLTGPLVVSIEADRTYVRVGRTVQFTGLIEGRVADSRWEFGDGTIVSNQPYASHAWVSTGEYEVRLRAYNETCPEGIAATLTILVLEPQLYVFSNSSNPTPPYTDWATAAHTIQEAMDFAEPGDLVLVTNGVYAPISVTKPITVLSVNGPAATRIDGGGSSRCVWLGSNAVLSGFTLTNGCATSVGPANGGGVWCASASAVVTNCALTGNSAEDDGGGAYGGTLYNCTLTGNSAYGYSKWSGLGGGAYGSTLYNCTLTGNSAWRGGGVYGGSLKNCIVYYNSSPTGPNYFYGPAFAYTCTTPLPPGEGNMDADPAFVNTNGWSNLRLQSNSPCINAGNNTYVSTLTDLDGRPRIVGGRVDMGAYEYQGPGMNEFIAWLRQCCLPTDGSADSTDPDRDGHTVLQEWEADTHPTDAASCLRLLAVRPGPPYTVTVQSSAARRYTLECCADLGSGAWMPVPGQTDIPGVDGPLTLSDPGTTPGPRFYRVSVRRP